METVSEEFWAKWFYDRWLSDSQLSDCSPATRGIWVDAISLMMQQKTDTVSGSVEKLASKLRCTPEQLMTAYAELRDNFTANCNEDNGVITLQCRRLAREYKKLNQNALRQERYQVKKLANAVSNEIITEQGSTLLYSTVTPDMILTVYKAYPLKVGRPAAIKAIGRAVQKHGYEHVLSKTIAYAAARNGNLEFVPHPSTWFNQERYNDESSTWKPPQPQRTFGKPWKPAPPPHETIRPEDCPTILVDWKAPEPPPSKPKESATVAVSLKKPDVKPMTPEQLEAEKARQIAALQAWRPK